MTTCLDSVHIIMSSHVSAARQRLIAIPALRKIADWGGGWSGMGCGGAVGVGGKAGTGGGGRERERRGSAVEYLDF